jgi:hypothetical protein
MKIHKTLDIDPGLDLVVAVGSWTRFICGQRSRGWLIAALFCLLVGCASGGKTITFQHHYHRQDLSFNEEDLKQLQFYISGHRRSVSRCHGNEVRAGARNDAGCCDGFRPELGQSEL